MKILEAGHKYQLDTIDGENLSILTFVKREGVKYPFNKGSHPGTNVQEVLRVLIDRTRFLLHQVPCMETENALHNLESALAWYEVRAARHHGRILTVPSVMALPSLPPCPVCGHLECSDHSPVLAKKELEQETLDLPSYAPDSFQRATENMNKLFNRERSDE